MLTVTFKSVVDGVLRSLAYDPSRDLNAQRFNSITGYINRRIKEGFRFEFWPDITFTEQRWYRPLWSVTEAVTATTERYYPNSDGYYQALQASTGQPPATTTDGVTYVENSAYWALSAATYTAPVWLPGTQFGVGEASGLQYQCQNPNDGKFYQCIVAHTAGATFDATKFGVLTPLNKYVANAQTGFNAIDAMKGAWRRDPRVFTNNPGPLQFEVSNVGFQFDWRAPNSVWIQYRIQPPIFSSTILNSSMALAAGVTIYDSTTQDCWTTVTSTNAGDNPSNAAAKFTRILFPDFLASFVERAAFADCLKDQKQNARAQEELEEATEELMDAQDRVLSAQGQFDQARVQAYGGGPATAYSNFVTLTSVKSGT